MPSYTDIRAGLAANLAAVAGFTIYATIPATVDPPAIVIGAFRRMEVQRRLGSLQPGRTKTGLWIVPVRVYWGDAGEQASQTEIDRLADLNSAGGLVSAIEANQGLGIGAQRVEVVEFGKYGDFAVGGSSLLGFEVTVEVLA